MFRVGNYWATVWCNEHNQKSGPNEQTTRIIRSVNLERRFWNEKLKDGKGDWDSTSRYGLGDVHNALAVLELATDYLKETEGDVTRGARPFAGCDSIQAASLFGGWSFFNSMWS